MIKGELDFFPSREKKYSKSNQKRALTRHSLKFYANHAITNRRWNKSKLSYFKAKDFQHEQHHQLSGKWTASICLLQLIQLLLIKSDLNISDDIPQRK